MATVLPPPLVLADNGHRDYPPGEARAVLREGFALFLAGLGNAARMSSETATDLFDARQFGVERDANEFLARREEWVQHFAATLSDLFERRLAGHRRQGRRPDADVSLSTLRVLNAFDQEKQAALTLATRVLQRWARKEFGALEMRAARLLGFGDAYGVDTRDADVPFSPDYVIDALGASVRALFPNPRVWRPFMERLLTDLTPAVPKTYITVNRFFADRGVLPEIKAALRVRSELRPFDDKDLLPLFSRLLHEATTSIDAINVEVPPILHETHAGAAPPDAHAPDATPPVAIDPVAQEAVRATADFWSSTMAASQAIAPDADDGFPDLDPRLTLGASSPVFEVLQQWQSFDLRDERTRRDLAARGVDTDVLPLNRVPYLRAAIGEQAMTPTDRITMDVIALLFDYVFRDPSIPDSTGGIFGRLQVPVLKAAMLDRTFFSDPRHPARRLLDRLAAAAAGSGTDRAYRLAFDAVATRIVDDVCGEFELDVGVFDRADVRLRGFVEGEQRNTAVALTPDVTTALAAEERDADRAQVRAMLRDRLAGLALPDEVRAFVESVWADYLTRLREQQGEAGVEFRVAVQTLDDLLWSISAKERTAQKARLTKMVPSIIGGLRRGVGRLALADERVRPFFDTLYTLHIAAIKPRPRKAPPSPRADTPVVTTAFDGDARAMPAAAADVAPPEAIPALDEPPEEGSFAGTDNVHDFVSEMVLGTWIAFRLDGEMMNARLSWISPLRTRYIFTSRSRSRAVVFGPEDLAWEIGAGNARPLLEPVPLFDRAVSAALDSLATYGTPGDEAAGAPA